MRFKRKEPEVADQDGDYWFKHRMLITRGAQAILNPDEVLAIIQELQALAEEYQGIDYMQVYESEDCLTIWVIDQLSKTMINEGDYTDEDGYATILLPSEY